MLDFILPGRPRRGPLIDRRFFGQRADRYPRHLFAMPQGAELPVVGHPANHNGVEIPFIKNLFDLLFTALFGHQQHALLGLREQNFVGRHAALAHRHAVEVELDAAAAPARHLGGRTGETGGAHVLDADDVVMLEQLQASFEQQFFGERIAHLHRRPALLFLFGERFRRHGRAMNAVAPGLGADVHHWIAQTLGETGENFFLVDQAEGEGVDQNIGVVAFVEITFAAHRRHADAVAVAADAGDHAGN